MSNPVITVEGLGKRYTLHHQASSSLLRDQLAEFLRNPFRRAKAAHATAEEFWALRDVGFSVNQGEVLGIIGHNGAGKSTLLKILSRITEPTNGRVTLRGRVASLLEVGTGFHPELTGRENIFLNGAILGMARAEIRRKFDEIVAFAEVEKFLDTPVKYYSSGMYVRLAFAVAAHLEPEILIVDEVLAVGDMQFQQKCLGKMKQVASSEGRTVLLVSHNMVSIQQLCQRVLFLNKGCVAGNGEPLAQIQRYMGSHLASMDRIRNLATTTRAQEPRGGARFLTAELDVPGSPIPWKLPFASPLRLRFTIDVITPLPSFEIGLGLFNLQGLEIVSTLSSWQGELGPVTPGRYVATIDYGTLELAPGSYRFGLGIKSDRGLEDYLPEAIEIEVVPSETSTRPNLTNIRGAIACSAKYSLLRL